MNKTFKEIGEFEFIDRVRAGCLIRSDRIVKAIGDDAAAFEVPADQVTLLTTDLLVERVHFIKHATSGFNLGYKALAVNLSDIAAMGGTAQEAIISLGIPDSTEIAFIEDFYRGMQSLAAEFDVNILGGDTTRSETDLIINIAVVGTVAPNEILGRDQAQSGDLICTTGFLGDSRAGLHLILNPPESEGDTWIHLKHAHFLPRPQLKEARFLSKYQSVHAAIDISDGLSSDLAHIMHASARKSMADMLQSHYVRDLAVRQLCGKGLRYYGEITEQDFELALENLKSFKFVGFTDKLGDFWSKVSTHYGWKTALPRRNVAARTHNISPKDRKLIQEHNKWDIRLYQEVRND